MDETVLLDKQIEHDTQNEDWDVYKTLYDRVKNMAGHSVNF